MSVTALSAGLERCTGRVAQLGGEERREPDNIDKTAYWCWPTDEAHRSLDRAPPHRPLMNSHALQDCSRCTRSSERQSATNTPSYRCCPGSLFSSTTSCATLPVHRSSPALNAVEVKSSDPDAPVYSMVLGDTMGTSSWLRERETDVKI